MNSERKFLLVSIKQFLRINFPISLPNHIEMAMAVGNDHMNVQTNLILWFSFSEVLPVRVVLRLSNIYYVHMRIELSQVSNTFQTELRGFE